MTIKEVEEQTGLARSNIRFYEKERLIEPSRNKSNGYRDYTQRDVENIKKIAYLRTLGISIENIQCIMSHKVSLYEVLEKQNTLLQEQLTDLNRAKILCEKMLKSENLSFDELQVEKYVKNLPDYWGDNQPVFKLDFVSFLYIWGSMIMWAIIASLCLLISIFSYSKLPPEIPIQWSDGAAVSLVNKSFIFAYPAVCIAIRIILRPYIYMKINMRSSYGRLITEYLTNYLCFVALSAEVFSILFIYGLVKSIVALLFVDTAVLIGLLIVGLIKLDPHRNSLILRIHS